MHKLALCVHISTGLYKTTSTWNDMNKIYDKIPWGLAIGTLGVTIAGAFNGTAILGLVSITGGAIALVTALLARQQMEKTKLNPELVVKLK